MNKLIHGDSLAVMRTLDAESVDLVVTSPPYNLKARSTGGKWKAPAINNGYTSHNDCMPHDEYVTWQRACLTEMMRLLKPSGAIFYNHKWRVQGGLLQDRSDIISGFPVRQVIIWQRSGGMNFNKGYFLPTYEVLYMITKPNFTLQPKANAYGDVWTIGQERNNPHPAPFPVALAQRCILAASAAGGVVLDPFVGSGTTAIAAYWNERQYIGIDNSAEYLTMARERLSEWGLTAKS